MNNDKEAIEGTVDVTMDSVSGKEPVPDVKIAKGTVAGVPEDSVKSEIIAKVKNAIAQFIQELNNK